MRKVLTILALILGTSAHAQGPAYPPYLFEGVPFQGGNPLVRKSASAYGVMEAKSPPGGFKTIRFISEWLKDRLNFKYTCVFKGGDNQYHDSPTAYDSEDCPSAPGQFIHGFALSLGGADRENYSLTVTCRVDYFRDYPPTIMTVGEGQLCGHSSSNGVDSWVTSIKTELHRK